MKYISIVIIGVFFSCTPEHHDDSNIMEQLCLDYISYLENSEFKNKQILIHLREEESEDKRYRAFRVAAGPAYLPPGLVPNRFDRVSGFLVLFSLKEEVDPNQKENIERALAKMQSL